VRSDGTARAAGAPLRPSGRRITRSEADGPDAILDGPAVSGAVDSDAGSSTVSALHRAVLRGDPSVSGAAASPARCAIAGALVNADSAWGRHCQREPVEQGRLLRLVLGWIIRAMVWVVPSWRLAPRPCRLQSEAGEVGLARMRGPACPFSRRRHTVGVPLALGPIQ
jgi:hypothetical protein